MKNFFYNLFCSIQLNFALSKLKKASNIVSFYENESYELNKRLEKRRIELTNLQRRIESLGETLVEDLEEADSIQRRHRQAFDTLKDENDVLKNKTIPTLVASADLLLQRYDAETAIEIRRAMVLKPNE